MQEIASLTQKLLPSQQGLCSECWLFRESDLQIHKYKRCHQRNAAAVP